MAEKKNYKKTLITCYIGFITQAIVANFTPLLFLRFHNEYNIPLGEIALISTVFYVTQIVVDTLCVHSAAPSGSWCGGQRQLSAANGSPV